MADESQARKGIVFDGIEVDVTREDFDDYEIAEALAVIAEAEERGADEDFQVEFMKAAYALPKLVFKSDWKRVKSELREANGGRLPNSVVFSFVRGVMAAANAKN